MTWSYSLTLSAGKDKVRVLIGDTDTTDQLLQDEEIAFFLTRTNNDVGEAAAQCCEAIAGRFARKADKTVGDLSIKLSQKSKQYAALAKTIRDQSNPDDGAIAIPPYAGGISVLQKQQEDEDTDRVLPFFRRKGMDFETGQMDDTREFWVETP